MPGRVEAAVLREVGGLSAAVKREGLVESVLSMARVLDNPLCVTTHPSAARQLSLGLDKLHAASLPAKGRLASVAAMSARRPK